MKRISKDEKVLAIMSSPEVVSAVKLLLALTNDIKAKNYVSGDFDFKDKVYTLSFTRKY